MDNESKDELFSVKLNNDGGGHIKFARVLRNYYFYRNQNRLLWKKINNQFSD